MNIAEDFMILRNQVSKDNFSDNDLKLIFKANNFDLVNTLLAVEEKLTGRVDYRKLEKPVEKSEAVKKIEELRQIVNDKDEYYNTKVAK
jgi:hypothetical protein